MTTNNTLYYLTTLWRYECPPNKFKSTPRISRYNTMHERCDNYEI